MKKVRKIASAILIIATLLCATLTSCKREPEKFSAHSFDYFDTVTTITGYEESKEKFDEISADVMKMLEEYHRLYTIYYRYDGIENLCSLNHKTAEEKRSITADSKIIDMLSYSKDMYALTEGKVNIAMGSVLSIWHDYREEGMNEPWNASVPPTERLREAAEHTDIESLVIDSENHTVTLTDTLTRLDVGAIAKGYAVEMVAGELERRGISGYVLNVGGNVRTIGTKPNGEGWTVGIEDPSSEEGGYLEYLTLSGQALVTSGSYQRFYTVGDINYHHIIDPETLMPARGYTSVSIIAYSSALADALSTALFCMSFEEGLALIERIENAEAAWLFENGDRKYSSGFEDYIKQ